MVNTWKSAIPVPAEHPVRTGAFVVFGVGFLALSLPAVAEPMTFWTGIFLGDYAYQTHELHHFVLGAVLPILLLGVLVQPFSPRRRVTALHSSLLIWIALTVVFALGGEFSPIHLVLLGCLIGMTLTHPAGREQLPTLEAVSPAVAIVVGITALGGLALAGIELNAHLSESDGHTQLNHYLFMATAGASVALLVLYGRTQRSGWRYPTYAGVALLAVIGLASVAYPGAEQGSSLGIVPGGLAVLWAVVILVVTERAADVRDEEAV